MAKIIVAGDAVVIKSNLKLSEIKSLEKHEPKSLSLYDEDGKTEIFRVATGSGSGSASAFGVSFSNTSKDGDGLAVATIIIPQGIENKEKYVEEQFGSAVLKLNRIEDSLDTVLDKIEAELEAVRECIEVL